MPAQMPLQAWVALSSQWSSPLGWSKHGWNAEVPGQLPETGQCLVQFQFTLSTLFQEKASMCSSQAKSRLPLGLLLVSPALQLAKGIQLPGVGFQRWRAQYLAQITHSPGRISAHVISLLFWVPFKRLDLMGIFTLIPIPCEYSLQPW